MLCIKHTDEIKSNYISSNDFYGLILFILWVVLMSNVTYDIKVENVFISKFISEAGFAQW